MKYFITISIIFSVLLVGFIIMPKEKNEDTVNLNNTNKIIQDINDNGKSINQEILNQKQIKQQQTSKNSINNINIENTDQQIIQQYNENSKSRDTNYQNTNNQIKISKTNFSSNVNNIIKFSGYNIENISEIKIGEYSYYPNIIEGFLYILVEQNSKLKGEYEITLKFKDYSIQKLDTKINFSFNGGNLIVIDITPNIIKNDIERNIILQGKGFSKIISIQLSNNIVLKDTSFNIINDNVLNIKIPRGLEIGKYSLNIMSVDGIIRPNSQIEIIK